MSSPSRDRPGFREWIDKQPDPNWTLLPLTHICSGIRAEDILRDGKVTPSQCGVLGDKLAYFFYGRPAYRVGGDEVIKVEASCPYCFIFESALINKAKFIHAFDTGAFAKRLYKHVLHDDMNVEDFSLGHDTSRPNKLISTIFGSIHSYIDGDVSQINQQNAEAEKWEFHARAYIDLLASHGRNEPDDRICSIEVALGDAVELKGNLKAVIVPHTLWEDNSRAPWLESLSKSGVEIKPYNFVPGRHPDYYHALLEATVKDLYAEWSIL